MSALAAGPSLPILAMRKKTSSATIADVARECGVGTMTVSRVVNGAKLVSPETAARVQAAIKKLGYEPNEAARILKGQAAKTIGLIVPDLADTFFSICAHAVQHLAASHGYMTLLLASERNPQNEQRELAMMKARNVAGILIVPSSRSCLDELRAFRSSGVPVVMIDRTFPGLDSGAVMVENQRGAERAVNHLIEHGHRNILCAGYDQQFNSISQRIEGYRHLMALAGLKPSFAVSEDVATAAAGVERRIRSSNPPTAVFSLNNVMTTHLLHTFQVAGIRVPDDVAVVGFDDFELAPLLAVPLTAVRQPASDVGGSAARLLLEAIRSGRDGASAAESCLVLPTELIIRRSCGCGPSHSQTTAPEHLTETEHGSPELRR
jgi:LacI family transcriptional regulator, galactose operon repressor